MQNHGGSCNAYTEFEYTNYEFDVQCQHFAAVLDIFANCFYQPLFSRSGVDREIQAIESEFQIPGGVQPNVYSDGSVFQSNIIENRLNCPMKPRTFPFDQQECEFTFGCWSTHGFQVDVKPRGGDKPVPFELARSYQPNPEFDLIEVRTTAVDTVYGCCPEPYPTLKYKFRMRRHSETYNYGLVVPMILTTLAGFLAFVANPQSGERISLGATRRP